MSSKKYEQLINYVINEDTERAEALFHEIVVETSRKIYEHIMEREEVGEGMDTDLMQEIQSEEQHGMQMDEAEDDMEFTDTEEMDGDMEPMGDMDDDMGDEMDGDDMGDEMGGDGMGSEEAATKDDIMDIKDMLDEILAAFNDEQEGEAEEAEGEADMDMGAEEEAEGEADEEEGEEEESGLMEEVQLKKVSVSHTDGSDKANSKSPVTANSGKTGMQGDPVKFSGDTESVPTGPKAPSNAYTKGEKTSGARYQNSPEGAKGTKGGAGESATKPKHTSEKSRSPVPESRKSTKRRI